MPTVHIYMFEGRTQEQKRKLVQGVTKAISAAAEIPDSSTTIIIHDTKKSDYATGGVMASDE